MRSERTLNAARIVANDVEAAAARRTVQPERADHDPPPQLQAAFERCDVRVAIPLFGQKVEDGTIMPELVGAGFKLVIQDTGLNP